MDDAERACLERTGRDIAAEWGLTLGPAFQLSNFSFVAPAGDNQVLKVGWPGDDESLHEPDALELWDGHGAVKLLRSDRGRRALLLGRARPGTDLSVLNSNAATQAMIVVAQKLWRPAAAPFDSVGDHVHEWLVRATAESQATRRLLKHARSLHAEMDAVSTTLVHGDLHHHNVLDAGTGYVAIDPKPMLGEPEFDVGPFLWNPLHSKMTLAETERRLDAFADAGLDQARMRAWALIRAGYLGTGDWLGEHVVEILEAIQ